MAEIKEFSLWFLQQLPIFLMSEPICYFVGVGLLLCVVEVFHRIIE